MFPKNARLRGYRRAMLLYLATIVAPVCVLLWLGLDSFERQRQAIQAVSKEKLVAKVESEARAAAAAFIDRKHPIARHFFVIDQGQVVEPALRTPLPRGARLPGSLPGRGREIWQVPVDGTKPRYTGISSRGDIRRLSAHPDGRRLAFSGLSDTPETWVLQNIPPQK